MKEKKEKGKLKGLIRNAWSKVRKVKKRNLGIFVIAALRIVTAFKPDLISSDQSDVIRWGIDFLLFGGTAHSLTRTDKAKEIGNKIVNIGKNK